MIATVTSKGQVTVPGELRDKLGIRPGSKLDFTLRADGHLEVQVINASWKELEGMLPKPVRPLSLEEMEAAIAGSPSA